MSPFRSTFSAKVSPEGASGGVLVELFGGFSAPHFGAVVFLRRVRDLRLFCFSACFSAH